MTEDNILDAMKAATLPNGVDEAAASNSNGDDWDLNKLRFAQNFDQMVGAKPVIATVECRPPYPQEWIKIHASPEWQLPTAILPLKDDRENYLVAPGLWVNLWEEIRPVNIFTAINRQGEIFLWPVRLPKSDGRTDRFMETDATAAQSAMRAWTRRFWVQELKMHKILVAKNLTEEPNWPGEITFAQIVKLAFKDRYITSLDHAVIKRLRGEI